VTDPDRLARIRATYEKGAKRGLHDAGDVDYLLKSYPYVLRLLDEFMPRQRVLEFEDGWRKERG
jgi:hypothetical protein